MMQTRHRRHRIVVGGLLLGLALTAAAAPRVVGAGGSRREAGEAQARAARDARMAWWRDARFGLFIHWGLYAVPAGEWEGRTSYGEWIRHTARIPIDVYDRFRDRFNPAAFDPAAWARLAKRAGMKYIVITTKHHDGFCLFDSRQTDFTVMATPFRRDIMKELVAACRREGLRIGWYHSIMDWHHPDYLPRRDWERDRPPTSADFDRYVTYLEAQLRELLTNYGPIDVLWFDGQWESTWTNERGRDLSAYVRALQPNIIINNRVAPGGGDFGLDQSRDPIGDFGTPEQQIPATGVPGLDWETCMTMNRNWGYNRADKDFKPTIELVRQLVDIASKGGNYLLNVGPDADGRFPPESVERLEAIGRWMDVNGTAIHGTSASPFAALPWGRATVRRGDGGRRTRVYLHVFDWPTNGRLTVPGLLSPVERAFLLADPTKGPLTTTRDGIDTIVDVSTRPVDPMDTVIVLDLPERPDVATPPTITAEMPIFVDHLDVRVTSPQPRVELRYTTDGRAPSATSPVATGPIRLTGTTVLAARAFRGGKPVSPIASATFRRVAPRPAVPPRDLEPGLAFVCVEGDFQKLPDFDTLRPTATGISSRFELRARTRETQFAFRFTGYIRVPADGAYRFFVRSDDGSRLWIGDELVVDNDGLHSPREATGVIALAAGHHPITVAMFEQGGGFELDVAYEGGGLSRQAVPPAALFHPRKHP